MVNKNLRCKINTFFLIVQLFVLLVKVISLYGLISLIILTTNKASIKFSKHNALCYVVEQNYVFLNYPKRKWIQEANASQLTKLRVSEYITKLV